MSPVSVVAVEAACSKHVLAFVDPIERLRRSPRKIRAHVRFDEHVIRILTIVLAQFYELEASLYS